MNPSKPPTPRLRAQRPLRLELTVQNIADAPLPSNATLRRWARAALARSARVTLRVVGRAEGRRLNRQYRAQDHATNVLSFGYARAPRITGDLVLCAPVVAAEARAQRKPLPAHYAHLIVHGLLHLQGHVHARDVDAERMEQRERRILARLGFADPYRAASDNAHARAVRHPSSSHGRRTA